jgi:hypothetical protein
MKELSIPELLNNCEALLKQTLSQIVASEMFDVQDMESGERTLERELDKLLDQEEWTKDETTRLSALFLVCSYLTEIDNGR